MADPTTHPTYRVFSFAFAMALSASCASVSAPDGEAASASELFADSASVLPTSPSRQCAFVYGGAAVVVTLPPPGSLKTGCEYGEPFQITEKTPLPVTNGTIYTCSMVPGGHALWTVTRNQASWEPLTTKPCSITDGQHTVLLNNLAYASEPRSCVAAIRSKNAPSTTGNGTAPATNGDENFITVRFQPIAASTLCAFTYVDRTEWTPEASCVWQEQGTGATLYLNDLRICDVTLEQAQWIHDTWNQ